MTTPSPLYLVDAPIFFFRYYFAMPEAWHSASGQPTQAVYGFAKFLLELLRRQRPERLVLAFDESLGSCFRNVRYPGYKASRPPATDDIRYQMALCQELAGALGVLTLASDSHEADDLLGTVAHQQRRSGRPRWLLTRDKDLGQLLRGADDCLWNPADDQRLDAAGLTAKYGIAPRQFPDYLALVGDASDDIPGVPGVGAKTATALLQAVPQVEQLLADPAQVRALPVRGADRLAAKLADHAEQIILAKWLATIALDAPISVTAAALTPKAPDPAVPALLERWGLGALNRDFTAWQEGR